MFIFNLFVTISKWYQPKYKDIGWFCHLIGFVIQYSEMSAFFWLSTLSHNVWNSFRKIRPPIPNLQSKIELGIFNKKYKWYALYAWGVPMIVTFVTVLMQYLLKKMTEDYWTPGIGKDTCTLHQGSGTWEKLFYFHIFNGPILVSFTFFHTSISFINKFNSRY